MMKLSRACASMFFKESDAWLHARVGREEVQADLYRFRSCRVAEHVATHAPELRSEGGVVFPR